MYKHFFGLRENPFNVNPDPRYLFLTPQTQEALDELTYGIQARKGLILLTGEVGTGKTTLINRLLIWLHQQQTPTAFISNSHLEISHLFDLMLADFGVQFDSRSKYNAPIRLNEWLFDRYRARKTAVVIVDEAQGLPTHVLEQIRLLLNLETASEKLLQIVLAGQPELEARLQQPELRQIKQRIALRCKTSALTLEETRDYIQARLRIAGVKHEPSVFSPEAMNAIHFYSRGIPRVMNLLCEHALINAYVDQIRPVPARLVAEVAREFQFDGIKPHCPPLDFGEVNSASLIATRSMEGRVVMPQPTAAEETLKEYPDISMSQVSIPFEIAKTWATPSDEPWSPSPDRNNIPSPERESEASTFLRIPVPPLAAPELNQLPLISDADADLATEMARDAVPSPSAPPLRLVQAKVKWNRSPATTRGQIPTPEKPPCRPWTVKTAKLRGSSYRAIQYSLLCLHRWNVTWRDRCLSIVNSPLGPQIIATSHRWLKHPIHRVREWYPWLPAWRDRYLSIVNSTEWMQMKASLVRWLQEPFDPAQWLAITPHLVDVRRTLSHKKP
jgi:type II secretory pathway predicted ATPase ExeA